MIWIIRATIFVTFFLLTLGFIMVWTRRERIKAQIKGGGLVSESLLLQPKERSSFFPRWLLNWLSSYGQWALPDPERVFEMRKDLIKAGYRHPQAPSVYLGLRIVTAFVFTLPFLLVIVIQGLLTPAILVMAFGLALFGFFLPAKILHVKIRQRQEGLDRALPDIIDLFVVCMEAGLSINAALQRVSEEVSRVYRHFSDELQITAGELRAGLPWAEAFENMGKRTDVQSIRSLVGLMIQSNKLGASISDALRNHADFIRTQRILRAEERAAKLTIKMVFPLVLFIFPAILIVAGGPGIIHILTSFPSIPTGGGFLGR
jgi:tight adherence protein C